MAAATAHDCQLEYYDTRVVHMICVQPAHGMHNLNPVSTVARLARRQCTGKEAHGGACARKLPMSKVARALLTGRCSEPESY